ncbi:MAG: glycosyltransferase, partial [Candidatus Nanoarchaeia archaeon]|nr:glycosyltransferase [Candidatus Nanoarchaeia archaeon]
REFIMFYFFPYYSFDLENTLFYFLCGRYEFRAKGIDVFIKSLANLNEKLKKTKSNKTIVAFFWVPGNIQGIKPELLENRSFFKDIRDSVSDNIEEIKNKIIYSLVSKNKVSEKSIFPDDFMNENKKKVMKLMRKGFPAVSTHDLHDEQNDMIIKALNENGLNNKKEDRVKVIFYPIYLTGADGLLDLSYYECMQGSHLGVFPSYYEPWGYTPLEAAALGVSSVTTDLAGFGRYINESSRQNKNPGIFVINRMNKSDKQVVDELASSFYLFSSLSKADRIKNKMEAQHLASLADWETMVANYIEAHNLAIKKRHDKN